MIKHNNKKIKYMLEKNKNILTSYFFFTIPLFVEIL
jgi:hypothetical protein